MDYINPDALVETEWLESRLGDETVAIVDASWFPKHSKRKAREEYLNGHIPGAAFFDIDEIATSGTDLPHMLPDAALFAEKVGALGIGNSDHVIAYDSNGGAAAGARAWWMFRAFGHQRVSVLNGGFKKWSSEGRPVQTGEPELTPKPFQSYDDSPNADLVRSLDQMKSNIASAAEQVVDARSAGRFSGTDPEPWPVIKLGHIPGSVNLPFPTLMDSDELGILRSADEIRSAIENAGIDPDKPIVTTCGSGVTAAILALGLYLVGHKDAAIYDGSWSEWGKREDTPFET